MNASEFHIRNRSIFLIYIFTFTLSTLIDIWRSFVQGPPIDEQKTLRQVAKQANSAQTTSGASLEALPAPEESDEDRDPNDMVYIPIPGNAIGMSGNPYDDMEDDEVEDW